MKNRSLLIIAALLAAILSVVPADACGPCGSGIDCAHIAAICDQSLWGAEVSCVEAICPAVCADWITAVESGVCSSIPVTDDCNTCLGSPAPAGCYAAVSACGADRTGGITCYAWVHGGDFALLLPYDSLDAASALSGCACDTGCAASCGASCAPGYLDSVALQGDVSCKLCLAWGACSSEFVSCSGI